jgi:hypothetical protein
VNLTLRTLAAANGDRVIMRTGHVPIMLVAGHERALAHDPLSAHAMRQLAKSLLPAAELRALDEIGETKYELRAQTGVPLEDFNVTARDADRVLVIEIARHAVPDEDAVPDDAFGQPPSVTRPRSANVAGVAERVASGLRIDAEAVRALADLDLRKQVAVGRVDRVNLGIVAA